MDSRVWKMIHMNIESIVSIYLGVVLGISTVITIVNLVRYVEDRAVVYRKLMKAHEFQVLTREHKHKAILWKISYWSKVSVVFLLFPVFIVIVVPLIAIGTILNRGSDY